MVQQINTPLRNRIKKAQMLTIVALGIAFTLPFILVKLFTHKVEFIPQSPHTETKLQSTLTSVSLSKIEPKEPISKAVPPQTLVVETPPLSPWKIITTRPGDSLSTVFKRLGLSPQLLQNILNKNPHAKELTRLGSNQKLEFLIKNHQLEKMVISFPMEILTVSKQGDHYKTELNTRKMTSQTQYITATVHGSLYNTAKRYNVSYSLMQQMTEIFTWDIDFSKDIRVGDRFTIMYKAFYINDKLVKTGEILAVSYTNRVKTFQAINHQSQSGNSNYYTPQGISLRKAFTRYPLHFSHIGSPFSLSRYHPILHYNRPHKGVDLAAPLGTPIRATGDGRIEIIGRKSDYGNMIKIDHNRQYSTIYGHMLRFQKGLSRGSFVERGQIIGYVGQTGLASGPHCHYEFHVNHQPKNPVTLDLPRGFPVPSKEMASFKANSHKLLAQLNLFEQTHRLG